MCNFMYFVMPPTKHTAQLPICDAKRTKKFTPSSSEARPELPQRKPGRRYHVKSWWEQCLAVVYLNTYKNHLEQT